MCCKHLLSLDTTVKPPTLHLFAKINYIFVHKRPQNNIYVTPEKYFKHFKNSYHFLFKYLFACTLQIILLLEHIFIIFIRQ
jgi:hypothetical protein